MRERDLRRALGELHARGPGVVTTTEFLLGLLDHSRFVAAEHDTVLVESLLL